jgi:hypothetical protein
MCTGANDRDLDQKPASSRPKTLIEALAHG